MTKATLTDAIFDQMHEAKNLTVRVVTADDDSVLYRVGFDLVLDRNHHRIMADAASRHGRAIALYLRRKILLGFRACFAADEQDDDAA